MFLTTRRYADEIVATPRGRELDLLPLLSLKGPPPGQKSIFFPEHPILMKFLLNMYLTLHSLQ